MTRETEIPKTIGPSHIRPDRDTVTRTYDINGKLYLPPRRTRRIIERVTQRDEAWLRRRPHEPGYIRPEVDGEFPGERSRHDTVVYVERHGPDEMRKHRIGWGPRTEWRRPGGLWRGLLPAGAGRTEFVLVDERPPGTPDHGPFDEAAEPPHEMVAPLLREDPGAVYDYAERLRWTVEVYGRSRPGWWVPCPACHGAACVYCSGVRYMHPTPAEWLEGYLTEYGPDAARFSQLLQAGQLDTPELRATHLSPGNLRALELAEFVAEDVRFGPFAEMNGAELRRAHETFERVQRYPDFARDWDPSQARERREIEGRALLDVMYVLRLPPWRPKHAANAHMRR